MSTELTARQREFLGIVRDSLLRLGKSPSYREICDRMGISINAVTGHRKTLVRKGYLVDDAREARAFRLTANEVEVRCDSDTVTLATTGPIRMTANA
jgi:DNA-binding CsgD family transcriptional regulator